MGKLRCRSDSFSPHHSFPREQGKEWWGLAEQARATSRASSGIAGGVAPAYSTDSLSDLPRHPDPA